MRGIGSTLSRLPAARAFLAGAALLAGATASKAYAQTQTGPDDTALAIPRVAPRGAMGVALPQPLPPSEAARIRRIFASQARGDIPAAIRETVELDLADRVTVGVLGHILADRHLGRFTRASAVELRSWLAEWHDLPDAPTIHSLLLMRLPRDEPPPPRPLAASLASAAQALPFDDTASAPVPVPEETEPAGRGLTRNRALDRAVQDAARNGPPGAVNRLLSRTAGLSPAYASQLRGEAGQILFTLNRDQEAFDLAARGVTTCRSSSTPHCEDAALAGYVAGLAAWRLGRVELAGPMFEAGWRAEITTSALRAATAFWAARARAATHDRDGFTRWALNAAEERRTFYGMIARRVLGMGIGAASGPREMLSEADVEAVSATPSGLRAFALLQVGQADRAEAELRLLWPLAQTTPALGRAVMLVAERAGLMDLAAQLADLVQTADGRPRETMRFTIPRLRPSGGFIVDPAMVYALARTESNFDAQMISPAGARGLMQIMPATARFIVGDAASGNARIELHDPAVNLNLGQRYVAYLAGHDAVAGNLVRLLASYNSGPGNFGRWGAALRDMGDPLLFIEAVPIDETRAFIPRVLAYTWIYAARLGMPTPSLDELAEGLWPRYRPFDAAEGVTRAVMH